LTLNKLHQSIGTTYTEN